MSKEQPVVIKAKVSFFKLLFTSCLGTALGLGLIVAIFVGIGTASSSLSSDTELKPNTVLKLQFNQAVPELSNNIAQDKYDIEKMFTKNIGLNDISKAIDLAIEDDKIKGIYLDLSSVPIGWASTKVIRNKLKEFKDAGKFITSYSTRYTQKSYYLASVADSIYLHPQGDFSFTGFSAQMMYFKGLMDKMGVTAQIFYAGKFKSATEPFRRKNMTEANREQVTKFMSGMYDIYLEALAQSRNTTAEELFNIADNALIRQPEDAVKYKMVDALKYKDEILDELRNKLGTEEGKKIEVTTLSAYWSSQKEKEELDTETDQIAIVYAEGSIVDGQGEKGSIGGDKYAAIIRKIRKNENVKAIVMRVNSGGGSALASDIIWRELELAKKQGIRVVTSMGDVAASGGYYIASNSDRIFAEDNTITGSIGVFGMIPNMRGLFEEHLGITMDTVNIGKFAMMSGGSVFYEFSEEQGNIIQQSVDRVYTTFKTRVSDGRGMSMASVDSVAQGRVWLGNTALQIGLVDELGGLNDAIEAVAKLANITDYKTVDYPKTKSFEEKITILLSGKKDKDEDESDNVKVEILQELKKSMTSPDIEQLQQLMKWTKTIEETKGIQMRLPYELEIQ